MYVAQSGMLDHRLIPIAPSGAMSPVETSSSTTIVTRPSIVSGSGLPFGGAAMLSGGGPSVRGPAISPLSAVAAAVAGEHRYTASPSVPLRPGKLRLNVRTDGTPAA